MELFPFRSNTHSVLFLQLTQNGFVHMCASVLENNAYVCPLIVPIRRSRTIVLFRDDHDSWSRSKFRWTSSLSDQGRHPLPPLLISLHSWSESPFAESPSKVPEQPLLLSARLGHVDPIGLGVLLEIARVPGEPKLWHNWRLQLLRPHLIPINCLEEAETETCSIVVNFIIIHPTSPWLGLFQFFSPMFFHVLSTVSQVAQPFVCVLRGKEPRHFVTKGVTAPSSSQKAWSSTSSIIIITTRPKPAYGRQGLAGSWGQDTNQARIFWGVLNLSLRASGAQLGYKLT